MKRGLQLDRYLRLEARQDISDGAGGFVETWAARGNLWANVVARSGTARSGEFGASARQALKITVRAAPQGHPARPKSGERLIDGGRIYTVLAVHEDARAARFLTLAAREEDPA